MKKFFAVMLLAVGIIFGSQVADVSKASAADVYAFTEKSIEVYVYDIDYNANPKDNVGGFDYNQFKAFDLIWGVTSAEADAAFIAKTKFVQNGKVLSTDYSWRFVKHAGTVYFLALENGHVISGSIYGQLSRDEGARAIYDAAEKYKGLAEGDRIEKE